MQSRPKIWQATLAFAAIGCLVPIAGAETESGVEWRGFLTTGVAVSDSDNVYSGGINRTPNYEKHTRFGLNLGSKISSSVDVTAQFISANNQLRTDAAFATWYPLNGMNIRVGKQGFPVWLMSDRLDVGKTYPWITPPEEVYNQNPIRAISGAGAGYTFDIAQIEVMAETVFGTFSSTTDSAEGGATEIKGKEVVASSLTLGTDKIKIRAANARAEGSVGNNLYNIAKLTANFTSYGLQLVHGDFLMISEYAKISSKVDKKEKKKANKDAADAVFKAATSDEEVVRLQAQKAVVNALAHNSTPIGGSSYYLTLGYHFGDLLPHLSYAHLTAPKDSLTFGDQYSTTAGLKYDVNLNTDIKIEWQQVVPDKNSRGLFQKKIADAAKTFDKTNIYKIALDFEF